MKLTDLMTLIAVLELPTSDLDFLGLDYRNAVSGLDGFKKTVEQQRRKLAVKYHHGGGFASTTGATSTATTAF